MLLLELLHLVNFTQMLQVEEVHEHLVLNLDVVWKESGVEAFVILWLAVDKLFDLVSRLTVIVIRDELLVLDEETDDSVEE